MGARSAHTHVLRRWRYTYIHRNTIYCINPGFWGERSPLVLFDKPLCSPTISLTALVYYHQMFEKEIVIDGSGHIIGRLASTVAKELLSGQKVVVVRCEALEITGSRKSGLGDTGPVVITE